MLKLRVFGKEGCSKCDALKGRVSRILQKRQDLETDYMDCLTPSGLMEFCKLEVGNPNNIPLLVFMKDDTYVLGKLVFEPAKYGSVAVPVLSGLRTDYDTGNGTLPEGLIQEALRQVEAALPKA